jgi:hypothetical protein
MILYSGYDFRWIGGLSNEIVGARPQCSGKQVRAVVARNDDDGNVMGFRIGLETLGHFEPVHVGHRQIKQNQVRRYGLNDFKCLVSAIGGKELERLAPEDPPDHAVDGRIIIYNQHVGFIVVHSV